MTVKINRMLSAYDKRVNEASGVLSKLFRKILMDRQISPQHWSMLMIKYLDDPRNGIPRDLKSSARGNLNKELVRDKITWKVFRKALRFLGPSFIRFEIHFEWADGTKSIHGVDLNAGPVDETAEYEGSETDETDIPAVIDYAKERIDSDRRYEERMRKNLTRNSYLPPIREHGFIAQETAPTKEENQKSS